MRRGRWSPGTTGGSVTGNIEPHRGRCVETFDHSSADSLTTEGDANWDNDVEYCLGVPLSLNICYPDPVLVNVGALEINTNPAITLPSSLTRSGDIDVPIPHDFSS